MSDETDGKPFDEMLDALGAPRRRQVLVELLERDRQGGPAAVNIDDGWEDTDAQVSMNHVHLPKLAEYELVDWDEGSNEVRTGRQFDEIRPLLELLYDHEDELPDAWLQHADDDDRDPG